MPIKTLVLAGRRASGDDVADSSGLRHRALLPIAGVPMLERVVDAIEQSGVASSITVSSDDPRLVHGTPMLATLAEESRGFLHFHRAGASPAASVADYFVNVAASEPVFVTTADHPLLTPEIICYFVEHARASSADFVVGMVPATVYRRRFPGQPRTFLRMRGEQYSGANLFLMRTPSSVAVPRFWTRAEAHRKTPWRLVQVFGMGNLVRFLLGRFDLSAALAEASSVIGVKVEAVELPFAEAALDVDKEEDRLAVEEVFARRSGRDDLSAAGRVGADTTATEWRPIETRRRTRR
ncbi:MAG: NTP transferase domain-containing protein [Candidatus Binatia bacterium]